MGFKTIILSERRVSYIRFLVQVKDSYLEKISSSVLLAGLASVSIFQLMSTEERSEMLTSL